MDDPTQDAGGYRAWKDWREENFGRFGPVEASYFREELGRAGVRLDRPGAMLEIGFGNGQLGAWARSLSWSWAGTELDPELVARARAAGWQAQGADAPLAAIVPGVSFDLIVAFDVLEHLSVDEITALLAGLGGRLAPQGRIVARFPSGDSPFSDPIQYGDLTHRTRIGSAMVAQLALRAGLKVEQARAPVLPLKGVGWRRALRRAPVRLARALIAALLRIVYFDNQPRVVDPNMLIVLRLPAAAS